MPLSPQNKRDLALAFMALAVALMFTIMFLLGAYAEKLTHFLELWNDKQQEVVGQVEV